MSNPKDIEYDQYCKGHNLPNDCLHIRNKRFNKFFNDYLKKNKIGCYGEPEMTGNLFNHLVIDFYVEHRPNAIIVTEIIDNPNWKEIVTLLDVEKVNNFVELLDIFSRNDTTDFSNIKIGKSIYRKYKDDPSKFNYDLLKFLEYEGFQYGERLFFHFNEDNLKDLKFHNFSVFPKEAESSFRMKMFTIVRKKRASSKETFYSFYVVQKNLLLGQ